MKKFFLPLIVIALFVMQGNSQNTFNKGDKVVNLTVGFGNHLYSGSGFSNVTPALAGSFEVGVKDELFDANSSLGIGGYVGYTSAKSNYAGAGFKYSDIILGVRGALHYQLVEKLDTYAGLMLGYDIVSAKYYGTIGAYSGNATASKLAFSFFLGGRYYFNDRFAGLVELGVGITNLNIGVAIKL